ncbi:MAG: butyryl-CoA:acetate CoA-transferase [Synergistaceae bacterium]|jgi:4-hydroxybutyrate CoA-transferase|nr:butyryl-CoA:acetate CoA-transferase [Synergistaceae bacterium]
MTKLYPERYITAQEAAQKIKDGDKIGFGGIYGAPEALMLALGERMPDLKDVETYSMSSNGSAPQCSPEAVGHIRHNTLFAGRHDRKALEEGRADFIPRNFSGYPSFFADMKMDVALFNVSPPDRHGFVSFGINVHYMMAMLKTAKLKIAQVNNCMPRCHGESFAHVSQFDWLVEAESPLIELKREEELGGIADAIGKNCADLVEDGATLQLGIGLLPNATLFHLKDKKDLGVHSETFSDSVMDLVEAGVITNAKKTLHPGRMLATFLMGTRKFYDFIDDNPSIYMAPVDYTNDPYVIAQNDRFVSINSCIQVDLMGQICAESFGLRQFSAVGGQVDFVRGAQMSKGGVSIIAFPSTTGDQKISKIVPFLDHGTAVTTSRNDVSYVITEYGSFNLQGKSLRERARGLIGLAHPNFRQALTEEYERRFKTSW